jgi:D-sedoheptulose 7-phosphate isomerase
VEQKIRQLINDSIAVKTELVNRHVSDIKTVAGQIIDAYNRNNKLVLCGNGGSAADAQHFAGEMVCRFEKERRSLCCISLTTDTSIMTAIGNDYSFDKIFSRQVESLITKGDVLAGISTSGNSKNVIEAFIQSKKQGGINIGFTGADGGKMKQYCDYCICVPSKVTARIQEGHNVIIHVLCTLIEQELFK